MFYLASQNNYQLLSWWNRGSFFAVLKPLQSYNSSNLRYFLAFKTNSFVYRIYANLNEICTKFKYFRWSDWNFHRYKMKLLLVMSFSGPYWVQMWGNKDQKNSEYGKFSSSVYYSYLLDSSINHLPCWTVYPRNKLQ